MKHLIASLIRDHSSASDSSFEKSYAFNLFSLASGCKVITNHIQSIENELMHKIYKYDDVQMYITIASGNTSHTCRANVCITDTRAILFQLNYTDEYFDTIEEFMTFIHDLITFKDNYLSINIHGIAQAIVYECTEAKEL